MCGYLSYLYFSSSSCAWSWGADTHPRGLRMRPTWTCSWSSPSSGPQPALAGYSSSSLPPSVICEAFFSIFFFAWAGKSLKHILRMYWGHYPQCNLTVVLTVSCLQYRIKSVQEKAGGGSCEDDSRQPGQVCASLISIIITSLIIFRNGKLDTRWVSHRHWWWHSLLD